MPLHLVYGWNRLREAAVILAPSIWCRCPLYQSNPGVPQLIKFVDERIDLPGHPDHGISAGKRAASGACLLARFPQPPVDDPLHPPRLLQYEETDVHLVQQRGVQR